MRLLLIIAFAGLLTKVTFPIFDRVGTRLASVTLFGSTQRMNSYHLGFSNTADKSVSPTCLWTCGPSSFDPMNCSGAIYMNGYLSRAEERTSATPCDIHVCGTLFADFGEGCKVFEYN